MLEEILSALLCHQGKSNEETLDEKGLNTQQDKILGYLRANRHLSAAKIAEEAGISARQAERILSDLKKKGIILRVGANRNGYWEIVYLQKH